MERAWRASIEQQINKLQYQPRKPSAGPVRKKWFGLNRSTIPALWALNGWLRAEARDVGLRKRIRFRLECGHWPGKTGISAGRGRDFLGGWLTGEAAQGAARGSRLREPSRLHASSRVERGERPCPCCGVERNEIGQEESWRIEYFLGHLERIRHVRKKPARSARITATTRASRRRPSRKRRSTREWPDRGC
jgi:hypothetical protein